MTCDNLSTQGSSDETLPFSEENGGNRECPSDRPIVSAIKCNSGGYCDNKTLRCKQGGNFNLGTSSRDTEKFSEGGEAMGRCPVIKLPNFCFFF